MASGIIYKMGKQYYKKIIALLTDFGNTDWFTASVKGVIKKIAPDSEIIDISNEIKSQSVFQAAFILKNCYRCFPSGTIFLCVVDPEVGSERKPLIVTSENYIFTGPDNGIFGLVKEESEKWDVFEIVPEKIQALVKNDKEISTTFHGRDIFAPTAAFISKIKNLAEIRKIAIPTKSFLPLSIPQIKIINKKYGADIIGEIIYIDKFGNLVTNIKREFIENLSPQKYLNFNNMKASLNKNKTVKFAEAYSYVDKNSPLAYFGSSNFLEIGVYMGRADMHYKSKINDKISIKINYK